jgi:hypothetical protein
LSALDAKVRRVERVQKVVAAGPVIDLLHTTLGSWDRSRRELLERVAAHKQEQADALVTISKELSTEKKQLASLRPALKTINPARVS